MTNHGYFCDSRECNVKLFREDSYLKKFGQRMTKEYAKDLIQKGNCILKGIRNRKGEVSDVRLFATFDGKYPTYEMRDINNDKS